MGRTDLKKTKGISIRVIHAAMIASLVVTAALLIFSIRQNSEVFSALNTETGNYVVRQNAAHELMEASDYLTEMAQRFTQDGDVTFMNNYFEEANSSRRREKAITAMSENDADPALMEQLQEAMEESQALMFREYYAMRLVAEARGMTDIPENLRAIELTKEDSFMLPEDKMDRAREMVMGSEYYQSKEIIRTRLKTNLEMLNQQMNATRQKTSDRMMRDLGIVRILIIIMTVLLAAMILLTARVGTLPLIEAVRAAREGKPVPVVGSKEFRYMAESYNEMHREREAARAAADDPGEEAAEKAGAGAEDAAEEGKASGAAGTGEEKKASGAEGGAEGKQASGAEGAEDGKNGNGTAHTEG
jgi:hypothetical protein